MGSLRWGALRGAVFGHARGCFRAAPSVRPCARLVLGAAGEQRILLAVTDDPTARIRSAVLAALPATGDADPAEVKAFHALLREYPSRPGKTLRGTLLMLSARAHSGDESVALTAAAALELFQNWVLIHDDIEDGSHERRGLPTLHQMVGTPIAINVGDALHVVMWQLLGALPIDGTNADRDAILREFEWMILRTAEGQHMDLSWVSDGRFDVTADDYLAMVTRKTAYYTVVSPLRLGAACASAAADPDFETAGIDLGVAFQIRDDVLNLTQGVRYGKEFAGDLYEGKRTLILAHLFASATTDERLEVESILALPREAKSSEDVQTILALMERHGSLRYAQAVAVERARRGLRALAAPLARLPEQRAAADLLQRLRSTALRAT